MAKAKGGNRLGVWIIVGLLFVGLIGFGGAGLVTGARTVATVGDKEVTTQAYVNALRDQLDAFSQQIGAPVSFAQVEPLGLPASIFAQVISDRVLDNEAETLGLSAGDERIRVAVLTDPRFAGMDGAFDRETYRFALGNRNETERDYETALRERLARALLQGAVVGGIAAPAIYADTVLAFEGESRSFTFAEVTEDSLAAPVDAPTEAEISAWFAENGDDYLSAEVRQVTYAWLTPEMLGDRIEVDDAALQDLYQERIAEFVQPERRLVERLVFSDADAATAALARITSGETGFDALVTDRGLDLADVDLGDVGPDDLGDASEAVFTATPGDVVGPFETALGSALFRMNAVLSAQETTFEEARDDLATEVATSRARRMISDTQEQLADLIAGGATIEDIAERTDLELGTLDWTADDSTGPAAYDEFRGAIAAATTDARIDVVELEDGGVFVLRLDGIVEPAPQPLDAVRAAVEADVRADVTARRVAALATEYAGFIGGRRDFADLGLATEVREELLRSDVVLGTPPEFIDMVFAMAPGDVTTVPTERGTIVLRLDAVDDVDMDDATIAARRADIEERATGGITQDIYAAYMAQLRAGTDIDLDSGAVEAVHSLFR